MLGVPVPVRVSLRVCEAVPLPVPVTDGVCETLRVCVCVTDGEHTVFRAKRPMPP